MIENAVRGTSLEVIPSHIPWEVAALNEPKGDTKTYTRQDDLKGEVVGAQVGTAFVDALKKSLATARETTHIGIGSAKIEKEPSAADKKRWRRYTTADGLSNDTVMD